MPTSTSSVTLRDRHPMGCILPKMRSYTLALSQDSHTFYSWANKLPRGDHNGLFFLGVGSYILECATKQLFRLISETFRKESDTSYPKLKPFLQLSFVDSVLFELGENSRMCHYLSGDVLCSKIYLYYLYVYLWRSIATFRHP